MYRGLVAAIVVFTSISVTGCGRHDCVEPDPADTSPPALSMTIVYRAPASALTDTLIVSAADSSVQLDADNAIRVRVGYEARDPEGLRRLHLGAAVLTTVGVGIQSKRAAVDPVVAPCPQAELAGTWHAPPGDPGRSLSLGLIAQNWAGLRATTPTVTVRLR